MLAASGRREEDYAYDLVLEPRARRQAHRSGPSRFPNVRIVAQKVGGDFKSKLKTTLAAGSGGPDIVAFNDWVTEMFPNADRFYDLYKLGAHDIEKDYLPWKWQLGVRPQGRMVALPIDTGPTALFYRADLFEQAGLPSDPEEVHKLMGTWDAYLAAGKKLQDALGDGVKLTDNIGTIYTQVNAQSEKIYFDKNDAFIGDDPSSSMKRAWDLAVKASGMGLARERERRKSGMERRHEYGQDRFVRRRRLEQGGPRTGRSRYGRQMAGRPGSGGDGNNGRLVPGDHGHQQASERSIPADQMAAKSGEPSEELGRRQPVSFRQDGARRAGVAREGGLLRRPGNGRDLHGIGAAGEAVLLRAAVRERERDREPSAAVRLDPRQGSGPSRWRASTRSCSDSGPALPARRTA